MARQILVLNGPNLNLLGTREPDVYGSATLADILDDLRTSFAGRADLRDAQSNSEGALIDALHDARTWADGVVFNPGAYTHTSVALRDALLAVKIPFIEVHLSNVHARETFRHHSYFSDIAVGTITGLGAIGYELAIRAASQHLATGKPGTPPLPN